MLQTLSSDAVVIGALRVNYHKNIKSLYAGQFFMLLWLTADFLQIKLFQKILSGTLSECQKKN